ncbi:MAG: hypothetical protein FWH41_03395 [Treponema sp.]|nr:hypothetical protein [Treponema sp.]
MDSGQLVLVYSRLILGASAVFLAIMLWSKTRDIAWLFLLIGTVFAYIEIIYTVLESLQIITGGFFFVGSTPLEAIILPVFRLGFIIAAFLVIIIRRYRQK